MYKTATITYTYGNGLISDSRKEAKGSDTEKRYYHYNHIGSTTAITDADGDLLYRIAYGTYGELTGIYDADGQKMAGEAADQRSIRETLQAEKLRFLYNGRYGVETGANGLYYMRARYYNPQIKRFINRDIIDGSITDSQSLNKYSYVQGNPISLVDPFGLCAQDYFSRAGHELLDWLGFLFDPADAINFLWYTAEGNAAMAAATAVAIVPAAGSFIAKGTKQAIKAGKKAAQKAGEKAAKNATEKAAKKAAKKKLAHIAALGYTHFPVCIAKTQYSFSSDPKAYGVAKNFELKVRDIIINNGAEMIVVIMGEIMRMPGLPKDPQAKRIDIVDGVIEGLS